MIRLDLSVLLVAMVAVLVHAGSLRGEFLEWDDGLLVSDNPRVREGGLSDLGELLTPSGSREHYGFEYLPVRDLSNRVDRLIWGMDPVGYHLGNILLFGVAAAALYGVLLVLLRDGRAALLGALLFAVHPIATETVACIAHRKGVLMAAFGLLAWLAWLRERRVLAIVLFAAAVLSKLPAVALPALFLLGDLVRRERFDGSRLLGFGGLGAVAIAATAIAMPIAPALGAATWHGGTPFTNSLSVGVAFLESVRLLVAPWGLHVGRVSETMTRTAPDAASLAGLSLIVALLVGGIFALARQIRRPSTGGLVLVLSTLGLLAIQTPYLQLRPFWVLFAERYLILALVPLCLAAGFLLTRWRGPRATALAIAILSILAVLTWNRETAWRDTETLFTDAYEKEPRSYIALDKVGRLVAQAGEYARGRKLFRKAVVAATELRPSGQAMLEHILENARQGLINANLALGRIDEARDETRIWLLDRPESPVAHFFRGLVAQKAGRPEEAEAGYRDAIRLSTERNTTLSMATYNLGLLYARRDGPGSAASMAELERAVEADPGFVEAWKALARGHAIHRRWEAVADALRNALRARPGDPETVEALASVLERQLGRRDEAREVRRAARRRR